MPSNKERIKAAVYRTRLDTHDALGNVVVGDCPTRSFECMAQVDDSFDELLNVLALGGVIDLDEEERNRISKQGE